MSLEAALSLSISELLRVLNNKLYLECKRLREYHPPPAVTTTSLGTEVRTPGMIVVARPHMHTLTGILQIERLETTAQDVLSLIPLLRNLLQPVNRLPPVLRIAQCFLDNNFASNTVPIVKLTHVCRYWRESITPDPANWTQISNLRKDLTALALERAKAAPLQVTLVASEDDAPCHFPTAYIQNIGTLRFIGLATIEELRQTLPGFPQSTPNLRSLKLRLPIGKSWDRSVDPFESLTPKLRCLQLLSIPLYPSILQLRSLTVLDYRNLAFDLPLDTLFDFLEENHSLKSVALGIAFGDDSLRHSRGRTPARNQFQCLSIFSLHAMDAQALVSGIALQGGARLDITNTAGSLNDIHFGLPSKHLSNLCSPTLMEYRSYQRKILLIGPNGEFSLQSARILREGDPFVEFPLLSLSLIQRVRLVHRVPEDEHHTLNPKVFDSHPSPLSKFLPSIAKPACLTSFPSCSQIPPLPLHSRPSPS